MIIKELAALLKPPGNQFEGNIVLNDHETIWTLHFVQGRLIYAVDGLHPVRRWNRMLGQHFPQFCLNIAPEQLSDQSYWQLFLLDQGFKKQQLSLVRAKLMLRDIIQECLFELSQCSYLTRECQPTTLPISRYCKTIALSAWEIQMTLNKVKDMRQEWKKLGITDCALTLSPALKKPVDPQRSLIPHQYITGKYSLWSVAAALKQSPANVLQSLAPLVEEDILELKPLADLPTVEAQLSPTSAPAKPSPTEQPRTAPSVTQSISAKAPESAASLVTAPTASGPAPTLSSDDSRRPLVACIDDSPVLAHSLKKILATGGYRTLIIQEPMQGFALLIEHMPSLILLDVMLPHTDGYNICRFLRDTPVFKKTPIIILTGRSKPVDRARASMAGATEFLVKPPEPKELLNMIRKYIGTSEQMSG